MKMTKFRAFSAAAVLAVGFAACGDDDDDDDPADTVDDTLTVTETAIESTVVEVTVGVEDTALVTETSAVATGESAIVTETSEVATGSSQVVSETTEVVAEDAPDTTG